MRGFSGALGMIKSMRYCSRLSSQAEVVRVTGNKGFARRERNLPARGGIAILGATEATDDDAIGRTSESAREAVAQRSL